MAPRRPMRMRQSLMRRSSIRQSSIRQSPAKPRLPRPMTPAAAQTKITMLTPTTSVSRCKTAKSSPPPRRRLPHRSRSAIKPQTSRNARLHQISSKIPYPSSSKIPSPSFHRTPIRPWTRRCRNLWRVIRAGTSSRQTLCFVRHGLPIISLPSLHQVRPEDRMRCCRDHGFCRIRRTIRPNCLSPFQSVPSCLIRRQRALRSRSPCRRSHARRRP